MLIWSWGSDADTIMKRVGQTSASSGRAHSVARSYALLLGVGDGGGVVLAVSGDGDHGEDRTVRRQSAAAPAQNDPLSLPSDVGAWCTGQE